VLLVPDIDGDSAWGGERDLGRGDNYWNPNDVARRVLHFALLLGPLAIFTLLVLFTPASSIADSMQKPSTSRRERWEVRHRNATPLPGYPARVLTENAHLLPRQGVALDLACGSGANALGLADAGLETHGWDWSPTALERLRRAARDRGLAVVTAERDVVSAPPSPASFDVIVVAHFLERRLAAPLVAALRPKGLLFYQTFTRERVDGAGPTSECFLLRPNELLQLFAPLRILVYREEGRVGNLQRGLRNEALLVGQKA
jgi:tellurite methyltransferase